MEQFFTNYSFFALNLIQKLPPISKLFPRLSLFTHCSEKCQKIILKIIFRWRQNDKAVNANCKKKINKTLFFFTFLQVYWNLASHSKSFLMSWHDIHLGTSIKNLSTLFTRFKSLQKNTFSDGNGKKIAREGCCTRYCFKLTAFKVWRKKAKKCFFSKSAQENNCIFTYLYPCLSLSLSLSLSLCLTHTHSHTHTHLLRHVRESSSTCAP